MATPNQSLPYADRDSANVPGHWLLARLGKRVLRPGGSELTKEMLDHAHLKNSDVVELAPGLGRTAAEILTYSPTSYTGIERDPNARNITAGVVKGRGICSEGEAAETGLPDASADTIVGEAMLTMQTDKGKAKIISEAARVLRPGGRYAIHELGLTPDTLPDEKKTEIRKDLARAIKVNARPLTVEEWSKLFEDAGFEVEWTGTADMALLEPRRNIHDEGIGGVARIMFNLARDKAARKRILTMRATFRKYKEQLNAVSLVARKPK